MSDARSEFRAGNVTIVSGASSYAVTFASPMPDVGYEVLFHAKQIGTYDIWPTSIATTGFTLNISPVADGSVTFSYEAVARSDDSGDSLMTSLCPVAWFRYGIGITSAGGFVSQWNDQSGNAHHLIQATGTNQPALNGDGSILFDGIDNFMKCATFTLIQPETMYLLFKKVTWVNNVSIFDGQTTDSGRCCQITPSPGFIGSAGLSIDPNYNHAIGDYAVIAVVYNGASSLTQVNLTPIVPDDAGSNNMSGFMIASDGSGSARWCNMEIKEAAVFSQAHDAATIASVINYFAQVGGLTI